MACPRCGSGAGPDDRWCVRCGAVLPRVPPPAPEGPPPATWPGGAPADTTVQPLEDRARWAVAASCVAAAVWAAHVVADLARLAAVGALRVTPSTAGADRLRTADAWQDGLAVAGLMAAGAALVVATRWVDRAYRNLPGLGARGLRHRPGWATWAWLVPGLQLVRPKAVVDDVWRASDPAGPAEPGEWWHDRPVTPVVHAWWATVLGAIGLAVVAAVIRAGDGTTGGELLAGARIEAASSALAVVAWVLSAVVVGMVTRRQRQRLDTVLAGRPLAGLRPASTVTAGTRPAPVVRRAAATGRPGAPWWPAPR